MASLLLAAIGLILVSGGIFAFLNFRAIAKTQAEKEARKVAEAIAERVANEYLQKNLADIMNAYRDMMEPNDIARESVEQMARTQDGPGENA